MVHDERSILRVVDDGGARTLVLDSPPTRNALSAATAAHMRQAVAEADDDPTVRAIVIAAAPPAFCAGADLREEDADGIARSLAALFVQMLRCRTPVVARVEGAARGAGVGIVAVSDIAVTADDATFGFPEVRRGLVPRLLAPLCARRMNSAALASHMLTARPFSATQAAASGLVAHVVAVGELDRAVQDVVDAVIACPPVAVRATKEALAKLGPDGIPQRLAAAVDEAASTWASSDARARADAFLSGG